MKKSVKIIAVAMAALMLCLSLASCGLFGTKLDGRYKAESFIGSYEMEFNGNKVTVKVKNALGGIDKYEGTYKIEDDTISFEFVDDDGDKIEDAPFTDKDAYEFAEDEETGDITIGSFTFDKLADK